MSLNLKGALALLKPQEQAEVFKYLAERLHQPDLVALAEYYQSLLAQKFSAEETVAPTPSILYRTAEERAEGTSNRVREDVAIHGAPATVAAKTPLRFEEFFATFDGEVFKPEGKIDLASDKRYRVLIDKADLEFPEIKVQAFKKIAARAVPMGIPDFAEQHDHYLYGTPKRK